jgi:hypothetical protein
MASDILYGDLSPRVVLQANTQYLQSVQTEESSGLGDLLVVPHSCEAFFIVSDAKKFRLKHYIHERSNRTERGGSDRLRSMDPI